MLKFFKTKPDEAVTPSAVSDATAEEPKPNWLSRLRGGLQKTSTQLTGGLTRIFTLRKLDQDMLDELEELLITSDLGPEVSAKIVADFAKNKFGKEVSLEEVKQELAARLADILTPVAKTLELDNAHKPTVIVVVGVNGTGKTTTIGKLAQKWRDENLNVWLAAGDTFRAAANEQLAIWAQRSGARLIQSTQGADSAGLAFDAYQQARAAQADVLLVDTAGRLHNRSDLMSELQKIIRVLKKADAAAPHHVLLVLDATVGQNAMQQVETFKSMVDVTGLIVTKLDGSAKAGVLVPLAQKFQLPVYAIGVGEQVADLSAFDAQNFANALMGIEPEEEAA